MFCEYNCITKVSLVDKENQTNKKRRGSENETIDSDSVSVELDGNSPHFTFCTPLFMIFERMYFDAMAAHILQTFQIVQNYKGLPETNFSHKLVIPSCSYVSSIIFLIQW